VLWGEWRNVVRANYDTPRNWLSGKCSALTFVKLNRYSCSKLCGRNGSRVEVRGNDFLVSIPFPLPSNHSHSHFWQRLHIDYLKAEKYVYCVVNLKLNMKLQQKHC